jgi:hypothetical protein
MAEGTKDGLALEEGVALGSGHVVVVDSDH